MSSRDEEWNSLFGALSSTLTKFGNGEVLEDDADFFLVDDDWGGHHQKLCVISDDFWSPRVEEAIQATLGRFPNWGVIVVFEGLSGLTRNNLVIYADGLDTATRFE